MRKNRSTGHGFLATMGEAAEMLVDEMKRLGQTQGINHVFTTFLEMMALCLSLETDPNHAEERKNRYEEIVASMEPETVSAYAKLCALTALAVYENMEEPCDILGAIYHELGLNNEWNGQFFTPDNVCRMMASIVNPADEDFAEEEGFISMNEPACGSGAMVIGAIWAMKRRNFDYQEKSLFVAQDIDIRCVWMAYIQLFLYRVPAIVIHGNTLTMEEWSRWHTPFVALPFSRRDSILKKRKETAHECEIQNKS